MTMRRIRIENKGGWPASTKVIDADTGEDITAQLPISRIVIDVKDDRITAEITLCVDELDIDADVNTGE